MANTLKMAEVYAIYALLERGWSRRRIAHALGIDRATVTRYAQLAAAASGGVPPGAPLGCGPPKPATAPPGSGPDGTRVYERADGSNPATEAPPGSAMADHGAAATSQSHCEPFRPIILAKLDQGLSAQRIHQDLVAEHGFSGKYHSVRRFVRRLGQATPLPFRRMECAPGEEAQIDFGRGAPLVAPDGKRRVPHVLRVILSHSRKGYSEAVPRQTTEDFIRALENAFHHFGGVPKTLVPDNLKAAVLKADWFDPELNPKIQAFCQHYGTALLPTRPRMPRHKGKCEAGVKFVQNNGLKGRQFASLADENRHLWHWEATVADTRIHGTTRRQVGKVFTEVERPALLPLPAQRFPFFQEVDRKVHRDGHVEVAKAYYSAPPEYVGQRVWVRWDGHVVRLFNKQLQQIACHAQREPGRFATDDRHIPAEKRGGLERGAAWWLRKARSIGTDTGQWAAAMLEQRGIPGLRVLIGLVSLTHKHTDVALDQACRVAQSHGAYHLRDIRNLLKRQAPPQEQFEFITEHPLIRSLADYGQLVHNAFEEIRT
ncbi:MAG: IS21 family transposase [Planctomycetes bacterium]|nr:IS21 family transposase [Planctomycetota bacterium]